MAQSQTKDLLLKGEELDQLDQMVGEMPTKYGLPISQFFGIIHRKRANEAMMIEQEKLQKEQEPIKQQQEPEILVEAQSESKGVPFPSHE